MVKFPLVDKDAFKALVEERLQAIGESAISAALAAGLPRDAIRSVLRDHPPNLVRAAKICKALGLRLRIELADDVSSTRIVDSESSQGRAPPWGVELRRQHAISQELLREILSRVSPPND